MLAFDSFLVLTVSATSSEKAMVKKPSCHKAMFDSIHLTHEFNKANANMNLTVGICFTVVTDH